MGPSRCSQAPTPAAVRGSKPGPVLKGRARRETPSGSWRREDVWADLPAHGQRNSWMWTLRDKPPIHAGSHTNPLRHKHVGTPMCTLVHTGTPGCRYSKTNPDAH